MSSRGGTVYLAAADRWGNMASFIYSNYSSFGSGVTVPGYGFPLQNRGGLFSLDTSHPNIVAPRKRPFHTIIPAFVMKDGQPVMAFGNMGGSVQPQAQSTEIVNMVDLGMNVQAAGDAARFSHDQDSNELELESNLYELVGPQLAAMGHKADLVQRRADGRLSGDPLHAGSHRAAAARQEHQGRPARQRHVPRRHRLPQGRRGGRLVGARRPSDRLVRSEGALAPDPGVVAVEQAR